MERSEEVRLINLLREGDQKAFTSLYAEHQPNLHNYLRAQGLSEEDIEDIIQEVFISLWRRRKQLEVNKTLMGYLIRAVHNQQITLSTKNNRKEKEYPFYEQLKEMRTLDTQTQQETFQWLMQELTLVADETDRIVMKEVFEHGEKTKDVAGLLSITPRQVRRIINRCCNYLLGIIDNKQQ